MKMYAILCTMLAALFAAQEVSALTIQLGSDGESAQERHDRRDREERRDRKQSRRHRRSHPDIRRNERSRTLQVPDLRTLRRP